MAGLQASTKKLLKDSKVIEAPKGTDTIRIWESFRDQAILWRALALLQIPATLIAILFAVVLWQTRSITLNVPSKPLPGHYAVQQIPDVDFIEAATEFVNLIGTYQPVVARRQYLRAAEMTQEPFLDRFRREMLESEMKAIENTSRTQVLFMDPAYTRLERIDNEVVVTLRASRLKIVAGKELPLANVEYKVTMTTIPRNQLNPYGIVVTNLDAQVVEG